jgi:hypothetical protein
MDTNFWGYLIAGFQSLADASLGILPHHVDIGMDAMVVDLMATTPILLFVIVNQFINLTIPFGVFTSILVLEGIRAIIAAWQWVKDQIPLLG